MLPVRRDVQPDTPHAGNLHRGLEGEEHAEVRSLLWLEVEQILPLECGSPCKIARMSDILARNGRRRGVCGNQSQNLAVSPEVTS